MLNVYSDFYFLLIQRKPGQRMPPRFSTFQFMYTQYSSFTKKFQLYIFINFLTPAGFFCHNFEQNLVFYVCIEVVAVKGCFCSVRFDEVYKIKCCFLL